MPNWDMGMGPRPGPWGTEAEDVDTAGDRRDRIYYLFHHNKSSDQLSVKVKIIKIFKFNSTNPQRGPAWTAVRGLTLSQAGRGGGGNSQRDPDSTAATVLPATTAPTAATAETHRQRHQQRTCETNSVTWQRLASCHYSLITALDGASLWQQED